MNLFTGLVILALILPNLASAEKTTNKLTRDLRILKPSSSVTITNVESAGMVYGKSLPIGIFSGSAAHIRITLSHYCSDTILQTQLARKYLPDASELSFQDLSESGGFPSAACDDTISYFWAPNDYSLAKDEAKVFSLIISNFLLRITATKRFGTDPHSKAIGNYFEYSNLILNKFETGELK